MMQMWHRLCPCMMCDFSNVNWLSIRYILRMFALRSSSTGVEYCPICLVEFERLDGALSSNEMYAQVTATAVAHGAELSAAGASSIVGGGEKEKDVRASRGVWSSLPVFSAFTGIGSDGSVDGSASSGDKSASSTPVYTTDCQHNFCADCLTKFVKTSNTCPLCRAPLKVIRLRRDQRLKPDNSNDGLRAAAATRKGVQCVVKVKYERQVYEVCVSRDIKFSGVDCYYCSTLS